MSGQAIATGGTCLAGYRCKSYVLGDKVGAPGNEVWMFSALKNGTTTIVADYASFVGSDNSPTCTFTAEVTVQ